MRARGAVAYVSSSLAWLGSWIWKLRLRLVFGLQVKVDFAFVEDGRKICSRGRCDAKVRWIYMLPS